MSRDDQDGLAWDETGLSITAQWTRQPSLKAIEDVCRQQLSIASTSPCSVSFYSRDAMHKVYAVNCSDRWLLMKILLPVYPHFKTRGEVATLQWVRDKTSIPVPRVVAFDDSNDNPIGFEWILMDDIVRGVSAYRLWRTLKMDQKMAIAQRIAEFQAELSIRGGGGGHSFSKIGTLDFADETKNDKAPGRLVSNEFLTCNRPSYDSQVPMGPFGSSHDWLHATLQLIVVEKTATMEQARDAADKEDAEEILGAAQKLLSLLPKVFPPTQQDPAAVTTALCLNGITLNSILLDDQGEITALLDWECVSAMPAWVATMVPEFLSGPVREEEPKRDEYSNGPATHAFSPQTPRSSDLDEMMVERLDDEGKNELYWIHLMEYDTTQLRRAYRAKMRKLWPDWPEEESRKQVDFYQALLQCNAGVWVKQVKAWVDRMERGESVRWTDMFETALDF